MSYEGKMLEQLAMPTRNQVEKTLLRTLLKHDGVIKEFGAGQEIVREMADEFELNEAQRSAFLQTIYRKQNRVKKAFLWHRLLFRAADALAQDRMVSRPVETLQLTHRREWMLTEKGFDEALKLSGIPASEKDGLTIKSYEVQKIAKAILESPKPENYDPIDKDKARVQTKREGLLRNRAFRLAVAEADDYKCAVCGLKIKSPNSLSWEVQAAHIVPHRFQGRDDLCNGVALCRLHHWAFDVGWFTLQDDYKLQVSPQVHVLPPDRGRIAGYEFLRPLASSGVTLCLPRDDENYPHRNAIRWHRQHIFYPENVATSEFNNDRPEKDKSKRVPTAENR